ncbi:hypothetical protein ACIPZF_01310 [Pseudomonas sp. NPDC089752]|uniref:hypothetical protein n=1 Tax=Pseudomonas sp. NPDC089752 TaxID=3364472 RepID=UPI00382BC83C
MINSEKLIDAMHEGKLDLHCVDVKIRQKFEGGLNLQGYGVLKVNQVGTIYLEFICKEADDIPAQSFYSEFPEDPFDSAQKLYLEAVTLDGDSIFAEEFSIKINVFNRRPPFRIPVFLHEIYLMDSSEYYKNTENYLYFELLEKAQIPANKMNKTTSTYGEESSSWDETELVVEGAKVTIIDKKDRTMVKASGKFDTEDLYSALLFYIGLSSGGMPQPYCLIKGSGESLALHLKSTHKPLRNKNIPPPFPSASSGNGWPSCHYEILRSMLKIKTSKPLYFDASYSQWMRVWHAFNSVNNITILTLGVAVEGLLNDIFIPALKSDSLDEPFEESKKQLIAELGEIEAPDDQKKSLITHVERWGNIHAGKALSLLVGKGLILEGEKFAWNELRNSAAHPKFRENTEARQEKEHKRISACLTLFYRLILNVYSYDGGMYEFGKVRSAEFVKRDFVNILG